MANNVETLRKAHQDFSAHNLDGAVANMVPSMSFTTHAEGRTFRTSEEFKGWLQAFITMSSDVRIIDAIYHDGGDWVTARFRGVGTMDGPLGELPATGREFAIETCEVWHFNADGLADEGHSYIDTMTLMTQLGYMEQPAT